MAIRKAMVAGNWKMNGSLELVKQMSDAINDVKSQEMDIVLFPPFPLVPAMIASGVSTG
ncbi:triose-phosphate isomerase, partial [Psychrobacter sp. TB20-MNA-CIBAN-0197]